jgi:hypothetical protein
VNVYESEREQTGIIRRQSCGARSVAAIFRGALEQIRPLCRQGAPEQIDGLRSLLLHFIEDGKRLRPIDRQLGALRQQFETKGDVAQGGAN